MATATWMADGNYCPASGTSRENEKPIDEAPKPCKATPPVTAVCVSTDAAQRVFWRHLGAMSHHTGRSRTSCCPPASG